MCIVMGADTATIPSLRQAPTVSGNMTRLHFITCLFILVFTFIKCKEQQKRDKLIENTTIAPSDKITIQLIGFDDRNEVIYKTTKADFIFNRSLVLEYCKNKDSSLNYNRRYKQLINYLIQNDEPQVIIPDTMATKLVASNTVFTYSESDTLVRIRDQESPYSEVTEAIDWMLLDVIVSGKIKILENRSNQFIDSVILKEVNSDNSGSKIILTTKGEKLFSKMTWIY